MLYHKPHNKQKVYSKSTNSDISTACCWSASLQEIEEVVEFTIIGANFIFTDR